MMNDYYQNSADSYDFGGRDGMYTGDGVGVVDGLVDLQASPGDTDMRGREVDFDDPKIASLPKILLMGPRRGGKTSIQRVVFQKMSPHETLFRLEATQSVERSVVDHTSLCRFTIWDFPGDYYALPDEDDAVVAGEGDDPKTNYNNITASVSHAGTGTTALSTTAAASSSASPPSSAETKQNVFGGSTSLLFVVDAQDEPYDHALSNFTSAVTQAVAVNPSICVEVFINKVDGELFLSDESKYDCRRDIMTQVTDELTDAGVSPDNLHIRYHLVSIYDHSIYEALSRVVQRLIPQLPTLENLLNVLVSTCSMEKAYLFDVVSKLYISTDSGPVDMQSVELCSDMIDVVLDVSGIYGLGPENPLPGGAGGPSNSSGDENNNPQLQSQSGDNGSGNNTGLDPMLPGTLISQVHSEDLEGGIIHPDSAYDNDSASVIRLSNGMVLYLKEVDTMLALVCITRSENFRKKSMINYNIGCLKKALRALVKPKQTP